MTSIGPRIAAAGSFQASGAWAALANSFPAVAAVLDNYAVHTPDKAAIIGTSGALNYGALRARVREQSASLTRQVGCGTAVALAVADPVDMAVALLGAMAGHVAVPLNPTLRSADAASALAASSAKALVVDDGTPSRLVQAGRARGLKVLRLRADPPGAGDSHLCAAVPDDPALLLTTSGTTGRPKLVTLSQANVVAAAGASGFAYALGPDDVRLNIMPLHHVQGIVGALLAALVAGGAIAFRDLAPRQTLDQLAVTGATWFSASPTMHQAILAALAPIHGTVLRRPPAELRLRFVRVGSAALTAGLRASLERFWNVPVIESYGMTEAHQIASTPLSGHPPVGGAIGAPVGADIATVATADGAPQLWVRGPVVASRVTAEHDNGPAAGDTSEELQMRRGGWLPTGDLGGIDELGFIRIGGRIKDIISVGGEKVSPREVEEVLCAHPSVRDAVVLGVPDKLYGETVAALIVPCVPGELDEAALRGHVLEQLAPFKSPTRIAVVETIRAGRSGKVERRALAREWFDTAAEGGAC